MTARSLTAREDDTHVESLHGLLLTSLEGDDGHTVSVGEHSLDFLLVAYTLCGSALNCYHSALQSLGEFGLIGGSCHLQCTFNHIALIKIFINCRAKIQQKSAICTSRQHVLALGFRRVTTVGFPSHSICSMGEVFLPFGRSLFRQQFRSSSPLCPPSFYGKAAGQTSPVVSPKLLGCSAETRSLFCCFICNEA